MKPLILLSITILVLLNLSFVKPVPVDCTVTPYSANCPNSGAPGPSQDETYSHLLVNLARRDPQGEGQRLAAATDPSILAAYKQYGTNLNTVKSNFNSYAAQPPLAWNPKLYAACKVDAHDMATYGYQAHNAEDGTPWYTTITQQGYSYAGIGQNAYAFGQSVYFTHAGFNVDWGVPALDHRANIMDLNSLPIYQEIGVSIFPSSVKNGGYTYGPLVTCQNFGKPSAPITAIIGVTYSDNNGDNTFTSGEGIGGTAIIFRGNSGSKYKVLAYASGLYRADLPADCYQVKFNSNGFSVATNGVCLSAGQIIQITARADASGGNIGTNGLHSACNSGSYTGSEEDDSCDDAPALYNYNYTIGDTNAAGQDSFVYPSYSAYSNNTLYSPQANGSTSVVATPTPTGSGVRVGSRVFGIVLHLVECIVSLI